MIELPQEVYFNEKLRKYTKLDDTAHDSVILGIWEREPSEKDYKEEITNAQGLTDIIPHYFGEWVAVPPEEIELLNKEIKKVRKTLTHPTETTMSARELEIAEARRLLASLTGAQYDEENQGSNIFKNI